LGKGKKGRVNSFYPGKRGGKKRGESPFLFQKRGKKKRKKKRGGNDYPWSFEQRKKRGECP